MANVQFNMGFKLDKSGLNEAKLELQNLLKTSEQAFKDKKLNVDQASFERIKKEIGIIDKALDKAFDKDLQKLNLKSLQSELNKSGLSIRDITKGFEQMGGTGASALSRIQSESTRTGIELKKTKGLVDQMSETFANTVKWGASAAALNGLTRAAQKAYGHIKGMDDSLNNIRIVTGKSAKEMEVFRKEANATAQALGKTTKEYSDASLIFFQQGKSAAEVKELTQATLVGANITGQDVTETADMLTAVLNGYNMEATQAMEITDKLAAVGAGTGSDFAELAGGMSRVAAMAKTVGVEVDSLSAQIATISTVTREAPESIGNALKTIYARMAQIKVEGSVTDEDGITYTSGKAEQALNSIGVTIFETNGQMKAMEGVIEEVGGKWEGLNQIQKSAVAEALAGQRQANKLISLFNSWDMYEDALTMSMNASGAALEQNVVRMDTMEAKSKQMTTELERLYSNVMNADFFKGMTEGMTDGVRMLNTFVESFGSLPEMFSALGGIAMNVFSNQISGALIKASSKLQSFGEQAKGAMSGLGGESASEQEYAKLTDEQRQLHDALVQTGQTGAEVAERRLHTANQEANVLRTLGEERAKEVRQRNEELKLMEDKLLALEEERHIRAQIGTESLEQYKQEAALTGESDEEVERILAGDLQKENAILEKKQQILQDIEDLKLEGYSHGELENSLINKQTDELTEQEAILKRYLASKNKSIHDYMSIDEIMEDITNDYVTQSDEVENQVKEVQKLVNAQNDLNAKVSKNQPGRDELNLRREIEQRQAANREIEITALKQEQLRTVIQGVGLAMQAVGAISMFDKLFDDSASAEEKIKAVAMGIGSFVMIGLQAVPMIASFKASMAQLAVAQGTAAASSAAAATGIAATGTAAAASTGGIAAFGAALWTALAPIMPFIAVAAGVVAAIGGIVLAVKGLGKAFKTNSYVVEENAEVLEKYNAQIDESRKRVNDLRGAQSALEELKEISAVGIDEADEETMSRYVQLSNEIASVSPELVRYYDEQGNAVINLNGNIEDLIDTELQLQKVAQEAKKANSENFAIEYQNIVDDETNRIEAKKKLLEQIRDTGSASDGGKMYDASDITAITAEITASQEKLKEVSTMVGQNIVDPIYGASEAYQQLDKANQSFARGLIDTNRLSEKLADPEKMERYTGLVEQYMDGLAVKAQPIQTELDEVNAKMEELKNSEAPDKNAISKLKEQSEKLKENLVEIRGPLEGLTEVQTQNALEMASMFDIADGKLDSFMAKVVESTISTEALVGTLSGGAMPSATDLMGEAGMKTSAGMDDEVAKSQAETQAAREKANSYMELSRAHQIYEASLENGFEIEEQVIEQAMQYKEVAAEIGETRNAVTESVIEENALKLEQMTIAQQELELQAQLEEQYWANVDALMETTEGYNQLADAYNQSVEAAGNMDAVQESLKDAFAEGNVDAVSSALEQYRDKIPGLADALDSMAVNGVESMGEVESAIQKVADMQGKMYAKMKGTDTAYWNDFKKRNAGQTKVIEMEYGVRAADYANYQEYEKALNLAAEKGKRFNLDETTRNNLLRMNEQEIAAWEKENSVLGYNDQANRKIVENDAQAKRSQIMSYSSLKQAGYSTFQALMISAASVGDSIANFFGGIVNSIAGTVNGMIGGLEGLINKAIGSLNGFLAKVGAIPGVPTVQLPTVSFGRFNGVGTSNMAGSLMDKWAPSDSGSVDMPSFDYGGSGNISGKPGSGSTSKPGNNTGGPGVDNSGGDKGSGGKGDKGDSEKEVEDLEWEEDIYHDINIQLEQKQQLLDKLQKQQDKLYGKELLDNLAEQKKVLQEQQALLEKKLEMQKKDLAQQRESLGKEGVKFNADGTISNYNKLLKEKLNYVNSLSGEAKEAAKEEFESLVEMMEGYEDMLMNSINETETAIQDSIDAQREIFLQEFDYKINVQLELTGDFEKAIDFQKEFFDSFEDSSDNYQRTVDLLGNKMGEIQAIQEQIAKVNSADLTDKERLERLDELSEQLKESTLDAKKLGEELTKIYEDTLKDGLALVKEHTDEYKRMNDEVKHLQQMMKLLGESDNYEALDALYETQYKVLQGQIDVLAKQKSTLEAERAALEAAGLKGSDEWKALNNAINDTQKDLDKLAQDTLKVLQDEFKNSVDSILADMDKVLSNGLGMDELKKQYDELKESRKEYLDIEEKITEVGKLQSKINADMAGITDPKKLETLQKFKEKELAALKEKDKLTKYDVDRTNLLYEITLKQMALEEQKNAKNMMRLVRDAAGNWVYEFVEDNEAVVKAREDLSDALEKLQEMDKKQFEKTQEDMIKAKLDYEKTINEIIKNQMNGEYATDEAFKQALQDATDKFNEEMITKSEALNEAQQNGVFSSLATILMAYQQNGEGLGILAEEQEKVMLDLATAIGGDFTQLAGLMDALNSGNEQDFLEMAESMGLNGETLRDTLQTVTGDIKEDWGGNITDMIGNVEGLDTSSGSAVDNIMAKWEEYKGKVAETTTNTGNDLESIKNRVESIDVATGDLNTETDSLIKKFGEEMSQITSLAKANDSLRKSYEDITKEVAKQIGELDKLIKKQKEAATGVNKPTGSTGGSSSNSGGGSSSGGSSSGSSSSSKPPTSSSGGSSSSGTPSYSSGEAVRVTKDTTFWSNSKGQGPNGTAKPNTKYLLDDPKRYKPMSGATHEVHISNSSGGDLGWVKKSDLKKFKTGGYTGSFANDVVDGKLAVLHEKELVLNKEDTKNMLDTVKLVRGGGLTDVFSNVIYKSTNSIVSAIERLGSRMGVKASSVGSANSNTDIKQNVSINADFSGVKNSSEIEKAFDNLAIQASQYAAKKK